jgi:hypothetical protein
MVVHMHHDGGGNAPWRPWLGKRGAKCLILKAEWIA